MEKKCSNCDKPMRQILKTGITLGFVVEDGERRRIKEEIIYQCTQCKTVDVE